MLNRSLLVCVLVSLLSASSVISISVPFTTCGGTLVTVQSVDATSWPPAAGGQETVVIHAASSEIITAGTYEIVVKFDGIITVIDQKGNLADLNVTLPVPIGPVQFTKSLSVPSFLPAGQIDIQVTAWDQNGTELACADMQTNVSDDPLLRGRRPIVAVA